MIIAGVNSLRRLIDVELIKRLKTFEAEIAWGISKEREIVAINRRSRLGLDIKIHESCLLFRIYKNIEEISN